MTVPEQIDNPTLSDYLEIMTRAIFQAGLRWSLIETKWPAFQKAFENFNPEQIAKFSSKDIARVASDPGIIRSEKKVEATVQNAKTLLALDREFNGFQNYLRSFENYEELSSDIKKRFKFMGELNVYYLLFRVKETVPDFETWVKTIEGDHPRMREMVQQAKET